MGVIDVSKFNGFNLLGFGKVNRVRQSNLKFPYEDGYITSSDVYAVTSKIARNGKAIPWILKKDVDGEIEVVKEGELYDLIKNPNDKQGRSEFVEMALLFLLLFLFLFKLFLSTSSDNSKSSGTLFIKVYGN